jgi:orotidine-5'-phosphate decarboxylase
MAAKAPIFLAVDTSDLTVAQEWVAATQDYVSGYKLGLEFFYSLGNAGIRRLKESTDADIFLDLKLHDIPNTVAGATRQIISLKPRFLTVHASGGRAMITAAVKEGPDIEIAAVTVLTSLGSQDLSDIGIEISAMDAAVRLALLAKTAGARAIVCSPLEIAAIRAAVGPELSIITPGVRPIMDTGGDDQQRTMDPRRAIEAGATYLVIGRPITSAWANGPGALRDRVAEISSQLN